MCDPSLIVAGIGGAASLAQGFGGMQAGNANAGILRAQGKQALLQSQADASNLEARGAYQLGDMRRRIAGSGNISALDLLADSASNLSLDVARIKHGGRAQKAAYDAEAGMQRQQGIGALIGGIVQAGAGVGTQLLLAPAKTPTAVYGNGGHAGY